MKLAISALAALGVLGAVSFVMPERTGEATTSSRPAQESKEALLSYQLRISGREGSCTVVKQGPTGAVRAKLDLEQDCITMMPRLAEARYWQEAATGEVIFAAADGRPIVEFFAADGVAYESLRPVSPLIALTAQ